MTRQICAALGLAALALAACGGDNQTALMAEPAHKVVESSIGKVLATNRGMTLYTFAKDTPPGTSNCNGRCAVNWPPLVALDDAKSVGKWTVLRRGDGLMQWAYDGKPLYGWHEDKKEGDTGGDGQLDGAWKAARP